MRNFAQELHCKYKIIDLIGGYGDKLYKYLTQHDLKFYSKQNAHFSNIN